jgi:CRP-like cAMP-binding protein
LRTALSLREQLPVTATRLWPIAFLLRRKERFLVAMQQIGVKSVWEGRRIVANPLIRKLECFAPLSEEDRRFVETVTGAQTARIGPKADIISEGAAPRFVKVILEGWCCRYKTLENGRRQIVAFLLPGDICDLHIFALRRMDHSLASLTEARYAQLAPDTAAQFAGFSASLRAALHWENLTRESIQREWTLNRGQRSAYERVAHLICELFVRQRAVGIGDADSVPFPITQTDLSDATGMSNVHVNRTLQELRHRDLIVLRNARLTVPDMDRLMQAAMFNPNYLHLYRPSGGGPKADAAGAMQRA